MAEVTIRDVAREAGLSVSSVSRILRGGQGHVYPTATHERVREIANRVGYRANVAARLLSQGTPTMIGMAVHFTEHPYLNRFLVAIHQELLRRNYDPVFLDSQHLAGDSSIQPFPPPHMLAGLISLGVDLQSGWPRHYAALREKLPIVAVQPVCAEAAALIDVIQVDFESAYLQAMQHLVELGHRHIAYCGVLHDPNPSDTQKNAGWHKAAQQLGLSTGNAIPWTVSRPAQPSVASGGAGLGEEEDFIYQSQSHEAMLSVVEALEAFPDKITALICASDEVALAFQSFLQARGKQLPRDLSLIGYDGISLGARFYPALTTIAPDYNKMAEVAVQRLIHHMSRKEDEEPTPPQLITVEPRLIVRSSTLKLEEAAS